MTLKNVPFGETNAFNVVVEVPTGGAKKYEYDHELDVFKLARVLYDEVRFPFNYGYVAETESGDGNNLDAFILSTHPLAAGTVATCRAVGLIEVFDGGKEDHKIIAIPLSETRWNGIQDISDLPPEFVEAFRNFYHRLAEQWHREIEMKEILDKDKAVKELLRTQILE